MPDPIASLYREINVLAAALRDVLRADDIERPCDHPHDRSNGCTHCYARDLVAQYTTREAA